jgi:hypothetical protein
VLEGVVAGMLTAGVAVGPLVEAAVGAALVFFARLAATLFGETGGGALG